jgi:5-methylcytosine-specific restriction endonuclease McrA
MEIAARYVTAPEQADRWRCVEEPRQLRRPVAGVCVGCGGGFFGTRKRRYCSPLCGARTRRRKLYREDPERIRAQNRAFYQRNAERLKAYVRNWQLENPARVSAYAHRRRARELAAGVSWTPEEWSALVGQWAGRCAYCGRNDVRLTVDHRIPLTKGGSDSIDNVLPACKPCNSRKGTRMELEYRAVLALEDFVRTRGERMTARGAARRTTGGRA